MNRATHCGLNEEIAKLLKTTFRGSYETLTILKKHPIQRERANQTQVKEVTENYLKTIFIQNKKKEIQKESKENERLKALFRVDSSAHSSKYSNCA